VHDPSSFRALLPRIDAVLDVFMAVERRTRRRCRPIVGESAQRLLGHRPQVVACNADLAGNRAIEAVSRATTRPPHRPCGQFLACRRRVVLLDEHHPNTTRPCKANFGGLRNLDYGGFKLRWLASTHRTRSRSPVKAKGEVSVPAPKLEGDAAKAVTHRGSHMQIIAAAGSGKTEVVSQRVADLLADGVAPRGIVAFTFTEKASAELKDRITQRVEERLGKSALDLLSGLFVGTIHSYCFRLLQQYVPRYEAYDVLDENQLTAFLAREAHRLELRQLDPQNRLFASIAAFLKNVDVTENELLGVEGMPEPFRSVLTNYLATLERYHLLTYGQQIVRTVEELATADLQAKVHADLRHLIVDEYQDKRDGVLPGLCPRVPPAFVARISTSTRAGTRLRQGRTPRPAYDRRNQSRTRHGTFRG